MVKVSIEGNAFLKQGVMSRPSQSCCDGLIPDGRRYLPHVMAVALSPNSSHQVSKQHPSE